MEGRGGTINFSCEIELNRILEKKERENKIILNRISIKIPARFDQAFFARLNEKKRNKNFDARLSSSSLAERRFLRGFSRRVDRFFVGARVSTVHELINVSSGCN